MGEKGVKGCLPFGTALSLPGSVFRHAIYFKLMHRSLQLFGMREVQFGLVNLLWQMTRGQFCLKGGLFVALIYANVTFVSKGCRL